MGDQFRSPIDNIAEFENYGNEDKRNDKISPFVSALQMWKFEFLISFTI